MVTLYELGVRFLLRAIARCGLLLINDLGTLGCSSSTAYASLAVGGAKALAGTQAGDPSRVLGRA